MPCEVIKIPGGATAIVCSRGSRPRPVPCHYCGKPTTILCDFTGPIAKKTCDRPICENHRDKVGPDLDHCRLHREAKK